MCMSMPLVRSIAFMSSVNSIIKNCQQLRKLPIVPLYTDGIVTIIIMLRALSLNAILAVVSQPMQ